MMSAALERATSRHARPKSSANCVSTLARRGATCRLGRAAAGTLVLKPGVLAAARAGAAALVAAALATSEAVVAGCAAAVAKPAMRASEAARASGLE